MEQNLADKKLLETLFATIGIGMAPQQMLLCQGMQKVNCYQQTLVEEMVCSVWKITPTENTTGDFNKNEVLLVAN